MTELAMPSDLHISPMDQYLFNEGRHFRIYEKLGSHILGEDQTTFAVWAPNAAQVSVIHDGNGWNPRKDLLEPVGSSGIWHGTVKRAGEGTRYKYFITPHFGEPREKADPVAFAGELPPLTASVVSELNHSWQDGAFLMKRAELQDPKEPLSIYEVHLGSWRRGPDGRFLSYRELGAALADHLSRLGFTHVELLPVMEHPYYGSWGYQTTSYFAPTARYGSPSELMALVDELHQAGIGVLLDWVPSHFATDAFSLGEFDGTHLYEHADPRQGIHPDWGSYEFNYGRNEVRSFLISSACFWLDRYHIDGIRVDAVASMLYLDYSRSEGQWIPNVYGGRENLEAIGFLRELNDEVHRSFPSALTIAEESTAWPGVSRPVEEGGLGFSLKWDMGWMHDTLQHLSREPIHRKYHYNELTFRALYAFTERFVLPLSHDEVVHGKGALLSKMPGDDWQRRANLRLLYAYQALLPGKTLLFMGCELGTYREWDHESELEWELLQQADHAGISWLVGDLNRLVSSHRALHTLDFEPEGFSWLVADASEDSVLAWLRAGQGGELAIAVANLTPVVRYDWRLGVPASGNWQEILNTDSTIYGGSGVGNLGGIKATEEPWGGQSAYVECTLPPLAIVVFVPSEEPVENT
ncbi:MAG: 1,4-alpha-glucan branching protein GlgB [Actinobacteria bacterium]|nr:1,4-alpha-glucan branching protein GlgB [Actinomycetota bacterium]